MPQRSKPKLLNAIVGTQLQLSVYMAQVNFPTLNSMAENSILYAQNGRDKMSDCLTMARSQHPTGVFFKIPKFSAHHFWAWCHSHPASFPIWGLLWQLWLLYPLCVSINCTQCLCTWTKSWIIQSPTKLNDKI